MAVSRRLRRGSLPVAAGHCRTAGIREASACSYEGSTVVATARGRRERWQCGHWNLVRALDSVGSRRQRPIREAQALGDRHVKRFAMIVQPISVKVGGITFSATGVASLSH